MRAVNRTQGANYTGKILEDFIHGRLLERGYEMMNKKDFIDARFLRQQIFSKQFPIGNSIYDTARYCDFILYHPEKWPDCLVIEAKWQQGSGSVDEKFPFAILNIKKSPYKTIVLLDGGGYKPGAEKWIKAQIDEQLLHVFSMSQFQVWVNNGGI